MEKKRNSGLVLVLVLASASLSNASSVFPGFIKWHVYVMNELNNESLLVHCKSKDDDLGSHKLFEGGNFTWSFRTDFLHTTLFWCHVKKDNNNNNNDNGCDRTASFDVFWYDERLFQKCHWKNCLWRVRDDGIYLTALYQTQTQDFYYHWGATRLP
ncbi:hypothetical protein V8G54_028908 [Vigna mungo]|uniref:S-protein homolog n=1 Tax=Vigna mungo TaxID=3915 RepID=A0AAQ3MT52_VIGMU